MKNGRFGKSCLFVVGFLVLLIFVISLGWGLWRTRSLPAKDSQPLSPVLVFLLSPSSSDEMAAGDYVAVAARAVAPEPIVRAELFVDGKSLGIAEDPAGNPGWSWQAWPVGIHTLVVRAASADGQEGQSQVVIVNVLQGDGLVQTQAEEGQTLEEVGASFGVLPDQMAGANPQVQPSQPLKGGYPVQVPAGGAGAGSGSGQGSGQPPSLPAGNEQIPPPMITWQFTPTQPVDKSYCYVTGGNGIWEKIPKNPFIFFSGEQVNYPQYSLKIEDGTLQAQCWGWAGDVLKFLGNGETKVNPQALPGTVVLSGESFQLVGMPQFKPEPEKKLGGGQLTVPPPFAVREPADSEDCTKHSGNILIGYVCDKLLNAPVQEYRVIEWEWQPKTCWPVGNCVWVNDIDGYYVYEIDQLTNSKIYMKEVSDPGQKVTPLPLPWGYRCYGIEAFVKGNEYGGQLVSEMATYCPGQLPQPKKIVLTPTDWITTGGEWIQEGDCGTYGGADAYQLANKNSGFGNNGEVLVGSYIVDDDGEDCFRQGDYSGAVKFANPVLPPEAVLAQANLKFSKLFTDYKATGVALGAKPICVSGVGKAKQGWTGLGSNHFLDGNVLLSSAYNSPFATLPGYSTPNVDVTSVVNTWLKYPNQNHGFILMPASFPKPKSDGNGICESGVGNFQLEIFYYMP